MKFKVIDEFVTPKSYHVFSELVFIKKGELWTLTDKEPPDYSQRETHVIMQRCSDGKEILVHKLLFQECFARID